MERQTRLKDRVRFGTLASHYIPKNDINLLMTSKTVDRFTNFSYTKEVLDGLRLIIFGFPLAVRVSPYPHAVGNQHHKLS